MEHTILGSIVLGIVEGITEFLPISSTGHLIIVNEWFNFGEPFTTMFNVVIQLGAILAVIVLYFKRLSPFKKNNEEKRKTWSLWKKAIVGVIPALVLGFILGDFIQEKLFTAFVVSIMLIIGGIFLIYIEKRQKKNTYETIESLPFSKVIAIGLIQCLAMIPGTSRSAASIVGASLLGASRKTAVEFSFFLAIPTMLAASSYSLLTYSGSIAGQQWFILGLGFIVSFIVALLVIRFFIHYIQKHSLVAFGYYRIILGILLLTYITI
jgi:undecaprenyl-diphosphatase